MPLLVSQQLSAAMLTGMYEIQTEYTRRPPPRKDPAEGQVEQYSLLAAEVASCWTRATAPKAGSSGLSPLRPSARMWLRSQRKESKPEPPAAVAWRVRLDVTALYPSTAVLFPPNLFSSSSTGGGSWVQQSRLASFYPSNHRWGNWNWSCFALPLVKSSFSRTSVGGEV